MGTSADAGQAELLFDLLENDGAARITLGPLDLAAQVALVGDVLGAIPDQGLIELAQAVRQAAERPYETTYFSPHLLLASALIYVRRLDEATAITHSVESVERAVASPWPEASGTRRARPARCWRASQAAWGCRCWRAASPASRYSNRSGRRTKRSG